MHAARKETCDLALFPLGTVPLNRLYQPYSLPILLSRCLKSRYSPAAEPNPNSLITAYHNPGCGGTSPPRRRLKSRYNAAAESTQVADIRPARLLGGNGAAGEGAERTEAQATIERCDQVRAHWLN